MRSSVRSGWDPCCKHASSTFKLILLITHVKLRAVTLLLLLCVINKKCYGVEALESIGWFEGKLNKERREQGSGTSLCSSDIVISCCCPLMNGPESVQQAECWFAASSTKQSDKTPFKSSWDHFSEGEEQRTWPKPFRYFTLACVYFYSSFLLIYFSAPGLSLSLFLSVSTFPTATLFYGKFITGQ